MARRAPEKAVQHEVTRFLRALGCSVYDLSQPRASMQTPGLPDLYAHHPGLGLRLWVEVKAPRGRVTPAQAAFIDAETAAGGVALVARSAGDLVEPLRALGAPIS